MRRRACAIVFAVLVALGITTPAMASAAKPAAPMVDVNGLYEFQNVADALWLHASSDYGLVGDASSVQRWDMVNPHTVRGVTYVQVRLYGTKNGNWCLYLKNSDKAVYLMPCNTKSGWQYFYVPGVPGEGIADWFIPYSDAGHYLSDSDRDFGTSHVIYAYGPGDGNWAVWAGELTN